MSARGPRWQVEAAGRGFSISELRDGVTAAHVLREIMQPTRQPEPGKKITFAVVCDSTSLTIRKLEGRRG